MPKTILYHCTRERYNLPVYSPRKQRNRRRLHAGYLSPVSATLTSLDDLRLPFLHVFGREQDENSKLFAERFLMIAFRLGIGLSLKSTTSVLKS